MIRTSVEADRNGIINLWKEAFGDTEESITLFLDNRYIPENTVISQNEGKITSMLFLLEGDFSVKDESYRSYYLYAAATLKEFRGRGIMKEMLEFAKKLANDREVDFICLKPAEESLFGFYEKHGYRSVFSSKTIRGEKESIENTEFHTEKSDCFIWNKKALDYAEKQQLFYGGKSFRTREGLWLYSVNEGVCSVKCDSFTSTLFSGFVENIDSDIIEFEVPCSVSADNLNSSVKKNGMALAVSDKSKNIIDGIVDAYLYFTLD